jgi:hypothetical protein
LLTSIQMRYYPRCRLVTIALLFSSLLVSCESDVIVQPALRGSIVGYAGIKKSNGDRFTDQSGISVKIPGQTSVAITKEDGQWQLENIEAGIHDIEFSKPGFASTKIRAYQFVGGGTAYLTNNVDLIQSTLDTFVVSNARYEPDYRYIPNGTEIDTVEVPNQFLVITGMIKFEDPKIDSSTLYIQPHLTDLSIIPSLNHGLTFISKGNAEVRIPVQQIMQYGYPAGQEIEVTFTTRMNNTHYYEPIMRKRIVTDPHNFLKLRTTIPIE